MIAAALLACAMSVHPTTLDAIIRVESGGNPLALHVNKAATQPPPARTVQEAASIVRRSIAAGYSVDVGIMQVNSRNLAGLGLTIEAAFDPCQNIAGGAAILTDDYARAAQQYGEGGTALLTALSAYNTGTWDRGFANGYVSRVIGTRAFFPASNQPKQLRTPNPYTAGTLAYSNHEDVYVLIE